MRYEPMCLQASGVGCIGIEFGLVGVDELEWFGLERIGLDVLLNISFNI